MADYVGLGSRSNTAALDTSGFNAGNLTNSFDPSVLEVDVPQFEVYHIVITSVPLAGTGAPANATVTIDGKQYTFTQPFGGTEWDPSEPMLLTPGNRLDFLWNLVSGTIPAPVVTLWLRYDASLPKNKRAGFGG